MKHLVYFNTHLSMTDDPSASKFNYHFGVVIIEIINAAMDCAPNDEEQFKMEDRKVAKLIGSDFVKNKFSQFSQIFSY